MINIIGQVSGYVRVYVTFVVGSVMLAVIVIVSFLAVNARPLHTPDASIDILLGFELVQVIVLVVALAGRRGIVSCSVLFRPTATALRGAVI